MSDHDSESGLTRGELARATGCNIETIRHYEKIGMLPHQAQQERETRLKNISYYLGFL